MPEGCISSIIDGFELEARLSVTCCTLDPNTWIVTDENGTRRTTFADLVDGDLSDLDDDEAVQDPLVMEGSVKKRLLETMNFKENFRFNEDGNAASRATNFSSSKGNSTNRSINTQRMALQNNIRKELQTKNSEIVGRSWEFREYPRSPETSRYRWE